MLKVSNFSDLKKYKFSYCSVFPCAFLPLQSTFLVDRTEQQAVGLVGGAHASRKFGSTVATILGMRQSAVVQDVQAFQARCVHKKG
jgi:hypothetical protein